VQLDKQQFRQVERWLYNIPYVEYALGNLRDALERLETRHASPPSWMPNLSLAPGGGGEESSRQQRWVEFEEEYPEKKRELQHQINEREAKIRGFYDVLDMLTAEDGSYSQLIRAKYIRTVFPDSAIYGGILFVSRRTFYRMRSHVVRTYFNCLPAQFICTERNGTIVAQKTA
jgi:hypothetical protein